MSEFIKIPIFYTINELDGQVLDVESMTDYFNTEINELKEKDSFENTRDYAGSLTAAEIGAMVLNLKMDGGDIITIQRLQKIYDKKIKSINHE
jgi:hypothetical protein